MGRKIDMGMFDSVFAPCPHCNEMVEFQTKVGICTLNRYHINSVPPDIAEGVNGKTEICKCGGNVVVRLAAPIARVQMTIIKENNEWD